MKKKNLIFLNMKQVDNFENNEEKDYFRTLKNDENKIVLMVRHCVLAQLFRGESYNISIVSYFHLRGVQWVQVF